MRRSTSATKATLVIFITVIALSAAPHVGWFASLTLIAVALFFVLQYPVSNWFISREKDRELHAFQDIPEPVSTRAAKHGHP